MCCPNVWPKLQVLTGSAPLAGVGERGSPQALR